MILYSFSEGTNSYFWQISKDFTLKDNILTLETGTCQKISVYVFVRRTGHIEDAVDFYSSSFKQLLQERFLVIP